MSLIASRSSYGLRFVMLATLVIGSPAQAEILPQQPVEVRILLDNSGSMYPGYSPPGTKNRKTREELGERFYAEYPQFTRWLDDFAKRQSIFNASSVSLRAFTSSGTFNSCTGGDCRDVRVIYQKTQPSEFSSSNLSRRLPAQGRLTYLTESLGEATRNFEGIIWLITDNIVEDRAGEPDAGVRRFFQTLKQDRRYASIHLFKLPFSSLVPGKPGVLAIYGIVVSKSQVSEDTHHYFDAKMRNDFLNAERVGSSAPLFSGEGYWKLKNLEMGSLALNLPPLIEVQVIQRDRGFFRERQTVRLPIAGTLHNRLTQHEITSGQVKVFPVDAFTPKDKESGKRYGLRNIPRDAFPPITLNVPRTPPRGSQPISFEMESAKPIRLETKGFSAWLKSATSGLTITYTGRLTARSKSLVAEFDRSQMRGIFGADMAPEMFGLTERFTGEDGSVEAGEITFELQSGYGSQLLLALLVLLLLGLLVATYLLFGKKRSYRIVLDGNEEFAHLRRLGTHGLQRHSITLGTLSRRLLGTATFHPQTASAAVQVQPKDTAGHYDIVFRNHPSSHLVIEEVGGKGVMASRGRGRLTGGGDEARSTRTPRPSGRDRTPRPDRGPRGRGPSSDVPSGTAPTSSSPQRPERSSRPSSQKKRIERPR